MIIFFNQSSNSKEKDCVTPDEKTPTPVPPLPGFFFGLFFKRGQVKLTARSIQLGVNVVYPLNVTGICSQSNTHSQTQHHPYITGAAVLATAAHANSIDCVFSATAQTDNSIRVNLSSDHPSTSWVAIAGDQLHWHQHRNKAHSNALHPDV